MYPLIYIHKGYSWYVPIVLRNGLRFADEVIYLGEAYGCAVARLCGIKTARISHCSRKADAFASIYRHHSELSEDFERFCIQRWFVLLEFMEERSIDRCVYLDTDVLLTRRIDQEVELTGKFGLTYTGYSAHTCIVHSRTVLESFCDWIMALYSEKANDSRLHDSHVQKVKMYGGGGVSDMTLFYWFQREYPEALGDYRTIFGDSPFDVSLEEVRGFEADESGFKRLVWEEGCPSAIGDDGRLIRLASIHHQGRSKAQLVHNAVSLGRAAIATAALGKGLEIAYRIGRKTRGCFGLQ